MADKKQNPHGAGSGGDRPLRRRAPAPATGAKGPDKPTRRPDGERPAPDKRPRRAPPDKTTPRPENDEKTFSGDRIAKVMARAGVCSRRDAEKWIADGRVSVNGRRLTSPAVNVRDADRIEIDGAPMQARERTRLFLFHKPPGLVTSARDPEGRETVFDYLERHVPDLPRVVSVGRLDINTEGLLLLTNDGGLARTLELPATGWTRRYRVRAHGDIDQARLDALGKGVTVDGVVYAPIEAVLERVQGANAWIAMGLTEGKNREIKRVLAHLGLEVTRLIRVSYGPFQLGELPPGAVDEVRLRVLRDQLGKNLAELAGVDFGAPARELSPAEQQERRAHVEKRPRKHVSVLRRERNAEDATEPRRKIERSATADRKGRAVVVERVTPAVRKAADATSPSRNARRFEAMRDGPREKPREGVREETREATREATRATGGRRTRIDASSDTRRPRPDHGAARRGRNPDSRGQEAAAGQRFDRGEGVARRRSSDRDQTSGFGARNADGRAPGERDARRKDFRDSDRKPGGSRSRGPADRESAGRSAFGKGPRSKGAGSGSDKGPKRGSDGGPGGGTGKGPRKGPGGGPGKGPGRGPGKGPNRGPGAGPRRPPRGA